MGTLGSLQVMEKNLNIEMGRGERARGTGEQVKSFRTGAAGQGQGRTIPGGRSC